MNSSEFSRQYFNILLREVFYLVEVLMAVNGFLFPLTKFLCLSSIYLQYKRKCKAIFKRPLNQKFRHFSRDAINDFIMGKKIRRIFLQRTFVWALPLTPFVFVRFLVNLPSPSELSFWMALKRSRSAIPLFFNNYSLVEMTYLLIIVNNITSWGKQKVVIANCSKGIQKQIKKYKSTHKLIYIQTQRES